MLSGESKAEADQPKVRSQWCYLSQPQSRSSIDPSEPSQPDESFSSIDQTQPRQSHLKSFPQTLFGTQKRSFNSGWYNRFKWLEYDSQKDAAFCHSCRVVSGTVNLNGEPAFIHSGYRNWKKATSYFTTHERSESDKSAIARLASTRHSTNVYAMLNAQNDKERNENLECLRVIFSSIRYLARQGLPLRKKEHLESNLMQLLLLRSRDFPLLSSWLQRKTSWTTWSTQNEILELMAHEVLRTILAETRGHFSVIVDETMDVSRKEQLVVVIRTVDDSMMVSENLLGLYAMEKCDAESITSAILDVLHRCGLNIGDLRGQAFDGASVMSGAKSGVGKRILDMEPRAVLIHCQSHSLNLAVQDACSKVQALNYLMSNVNELVNFIRASPKRLGELAVLADSAGIEGSLRPLCPTRWTLRYTSLYSLKNLLVPVHDELLSISETVSNDLESRAKARGFLKLLGQFEFFFMLLVAEMIFEMTDRLSKVLQDSSISACDGQKAAERVLGQLKAKRCAECFNELWSSALNLAELLDADPPSLPRARKVPKKLDDSTSSCHQFHTAEAHYCVLFWQVIDEAVGAIEVRINGRGYNILLEAERVLVQSFAGQVVSEEQLRALHDHFKDDIDFRRLPAQLQVLANISMPSPVSQLLHAVEAVSRIGIGERGLIPDVLKLIKLCLVLPASTASAERSFSTLRRIKSYLRGTISQERLNHLMVISTYKERIDKLDEAALLKTFILRNDMRLRTFALPK